MPASPTEEFFGFSHRPFRGTPDPQDYVAIAPLEQEIERLVDAAVQGDGIAVLTAAPGAGKTVVCESLRFELHERFKAVVLSSSGFATRRALLQAILFALGQSYESFSEQELRLSVLNFARTIATQKDGIVLIIDEAHLLNARLLEELRCLTNHSEGGRPLIRVILCGQLPLEDALLSPVLEALNYRITCHSTLEPLSMQESARLIAGRLLHAGRTVEGIFTADALETICRVSDGNPRCLIQLCDQSLLLAAEKTQLPVSAETVRLALHQLKQLPLQWNESAIDQLQHDIDETGSQPQPSEPIGFDAPYGTHEVSSAETFADVQPVNEPIADWSNSVACVEIGSDSHQSDVSDTPPTWSSYESEVTAGEMSETIVAPMKSNFSEVRDRSGLPAAPASELLWDDACEQDYSQDVATSVAIVDDVIEVAAGEFVELPVDDAYATLDHSASRSDRLHETSQLDEQLTLRVATSQRRRQPETSDRHETAETVPETAPDPAQRIEEVIAALSVITNETPAGFGSEPSPLAGGWRSTGDCRPFDVVEPGGVPQWSDQAVVDSISTRVDTPASAGPQDHAASSNRPPQRPYARLFSRVRRVSN